jgi:Tfp pilus assembly protein PilO
MANKKTLTKNKKAFASNLSTSNLIAACILVGILSIAIALLVGRMLLDSMMLNARVIGKKSEANKQIATNYDNLKKLQGDYNGLGSSRDTITTALPTNPALPQLWAMMENIGTTSGVAINSVSSSAASDAEAPAGSPLQQLPITVSAQGSYAAIQSFLSNIELSTRPLRVTNVALSGTNNSMQATLTITTYYQGAADLKVGSEVVQ